MKTYLMGPGGLQPITMNIGSVSKPLTHEYIMERLKPQPRDTQRARQRRVDLLTVYYIMRSLRGVFELVHGKLEFKFDMYYKEDDWTERSSPPHEIALFNNSVNHPYYIGVIIKEQDVDGEPNKYKLYAEWQQGDEHRAYTEVVWPIDEEILLDFFNRTSTMALEGKYGGGC